MKEFIGTCVGGIGITTEELSEIIDNGLEITRKAFIAECNIPQEVLDDINRFPNDYTFYTDGRMNWYTWSAIEHFYK